MLLLLLQTGIKQHTLPANTSEAKQALRNKQPNALTKMENKKARNKQCLPLATASRRKIGSQLQRVDGLPMEVSSQTKPLLYPLGGIRLPATIAATATTTATAAAPSRSTGVSGASRCWRRSKVERVRRTLRVQQAYLQERRFLGIYWTREVQGRLLPCPPRLGEGRKKQKRAGRFGGGGGAT